MTSEPMWIERGYRNDEDLRQIAALLDTSIDRLQSEYMALATNLDRQIRLWVDSTGALLAYATVRVGSDGPGSDPYLPALFFRLHPDVRHTFPRKLILDWAIERARIEASERRIPARLNLAANPINQDYQRWLEDQGFEYVSTYFRAFRILQPEIPEVSLPSGFLVRHFDGADLEPFVALFNEAVGFPWTIQQQQAAMAEPDFVAQFHLIAIAPDGSFAGLCICHIMEEWSARSGCTEGSISELAVRSPYRDLNLEQVLLLEGLRRLQTAGVYRATRFVIAEQDTDLDLYRNVGFALEPKSVFYRKEL